MGRARFASGSVTTELHHHRGHDRSPRSILVRRSFDSRRNRLHGTRNCIWAWRQSRPRSAPLAAAARLRRARSPRRCEESGTRSTHRAEPPRGPRPCRSASLRQSEDRETHALFERPIPLCRPVLAGSSCSCPKLSMAVGNLRPGSGHRECLKRSNPVGRTKGSWAMSMHPTCPGRDRMITLLQ
jgi:hypothetical protein